MPWSKVGTTISSAVAVEIGDRGRGGNTDAVAVVAWFGADVEEPPAGVGEHDQAAGAVGSGVGAESELRAFRRR